MQETRDYLIYCDYDVDRQGSWERTNGFFLVRDYSYSEALIKLVGSLDPFDYHCPRNFNNCTVE